MAIADMPGTTNSCGTGSGTAMAIGETAGVVWKVLAAQGPLSMAKLVKETEAPRELVLQALGWLAREDKLEFEEGRTKKIGLKSC